MPRPPPFPADEGAAPPRRVDGPSRWVTAPACVAAALLAVAPFRPWILVEPGEAARVGGAVAQAAARERDVAGSEAFRELGLRVAERGALTGIDLVQWARAAGERTFAPRGDGPAQPADGPARRGLAALAALVLGVAGAGVVVAGYLLAHRLARWRTPLLVLGGVAALGALAEAVLIGWAARAAAPALAPGGGRTLLLAGGVGLLSTVLAALTWENALRVLGLVALLASALAGLGWAFVVGTS